MSEKIKESLNNIRDECDEIEEEVEEDDEEVEPKRVKTRGDPVVRLY